MAFAPKVAMALAVVRLSQRVRRLMRLANELQDLAVDVATELAIVSRTLADDESGRLEMAVELALERARKARRSAALRAAGAGAWKVEWRHHPSGGALVRIDEGNWFRLARADARLLKVLAESAVGEDGLPAALSYDELAIIIARKTGMPQTRHALVESVYRIRRAFERADLNQHLLQSDRQSGRVRFMLRAPVHQP
jgi:hypothetical protein